MGGFGRPTMPFQPGTRLLLQTNRAGIEQSGAAIIATARGLFRAPVAPLEQKHSAAARTYKPHHVLSADKPSAPLGERARRRRSYLRGGPWAQTRAGSRRSPAQTSPAKTREARRDSSHPAHSFTPEGRRCLHWCRNSFSHSMSQPRRAVLSERRSPSTRRTAFFSWRKESSHP